MDIKKIILSGSITLITAGSLFIAPAAFADNGNWWNYGHNMHHNIMRRDFDNDFDDRRMKFHKNMHTNFRMFYPQMHTYNRMW